MNDAEARAVLVREIAHYRALAYSDLQRLLTSQDTFERAASSGTQYHLEFEAVWDHNPGGNIHVFGSINDMGWRSLAPLTEDFIKAPDDSFVDDVP